MLDFSSYIHRFLVATTVLPDECTNYYTDADSTRNVGFTKSSVCDLGLFGEGTWVRFVSPAGTTMPNFVVNEFFCGANIPGWLNGTYPADVGTSSGGDVCYHKGGDTCVLTSAIKITNCDSFYVFYLSDPPACDLRYCAV